MLFIFGVNVENLKAEMLICTISVHRYFNRSNVDTFRFVLSLTLFQICRKPIIVAYTVPINSVTF